MILMVYDNLTQPLHTPFETNHAGTFQQFVIMYVGAVSPTKNECTTVSPTLEPQTTVKCPTDRPVIRVKVVPATYGMEGFELFLLQTSRKIYHCSNSSTRWRVLQGHYIRGSCTRSKLIRRIMHRLNLNQIGFKCSLLH